MLQHGYFDQRFGLIILASASPRRAQILSQIGFNYKVVPSSIEEIFTNHDPVEVAKELALNKAKEVAEIYPESIVIGADTIVFLNNQILGKPASEAEAIDMLRSLSGNTHVVYTAFAIIQKSVNKQVVDLEATEVTFRNLSDEEIRLYVRSGSPMDKAGAYGIQDQSAVFVEKIIGDFYNVVGLPISKIYDYLQSQF
ncbi:septum formation inhibitor Maf [bacterium]|nr:MAG: septum formation inhibitor Maf [bacterium]